MLLVQLREQKTLWCLVLRVGRGATTEVWRLTLVAAGGLRIMHRLHIPDSRRSVNCSWIQHAEQNVNGLKCLTSVGLTFSCDGGMKTVFKLITVLRSRRPEKWYKFGIYSSLPPVLERLRYMTSLNLTHQLSPPNTTTELYLAYFSFYVFAQYTYTRPNRIPNWQVTSISRI
jgi:hypothetical protein